MKNGKSASDIPAEFYKYAQKSEELTTELTQLFATVWQTQQIPKTWGHSKLIALWKGASKGNIKDHEDYRALQVVSSICKIMVVVIINRLKEWYNQQFLDQQQGFRSGRGTADGIYITKRVQQITDRMQKPVYVLFVDLSAAFDHIGRPWLFKSIYNRFPTEDDTILIKLLQALYQYTTTSLTETADDLFGLLLGLRQGGPESPPLYNLYMDFVMRVYLELCKKNGIKFLEMKYRVRASSTKRENRGEKSYRGSHTVDWAGYADDMELFFEDQDHLQSATDLLNETFLRYHLKINVSKTKTMIFNFKYVLPNTEEYPTSVANINNKPIENVEIFRYLGDDIRYDEPSTGDAEIYLRIAVAETKFNQLRKRLTNHRICLHTRVYILNSMVRSRLTYSCQTWSLTQHQKKRVDSIYAFMLRQMVKGGFRRKKSDTEFELMLCIN